MHEAEVVVGMVFVSNHQPTEVVQPSKQSLYFPASLVATQPTSVLGFGFLTITSVRCDHLNPSVSELCIKGIRVIGAIADEPLRRLVDQSVLEGGFYERDLVRRSALGVYGDRKTSAVCHCHELRTFAPLGLADLAPPFLAATNVPSMKHSLRSSPPRSYRSSASAWRICAKLPSDTHRWNRRWQVWYGGYRSGRSCQGAPVRSIHRIPSNTARLQRQGRPRPSDRLGNSGRSEDTTDHCASVRSMYIPPQGNTSKVAPLDHL